jgi:hypothetical protein
MNKLLLVSAVLAFSAVKAQQTPYQMTDKEAAKHAKEVAKSRDKGDIIWDFDTVFVAGIPNCLVYKIDKGALQHDDYSIRSLTNVELVYVRYCTAIDYTVAHAPNTPPPTIGYYSYLFYDTKNTGETSSSIRPFKTAGRYRLVANGTSIDPNSESNFIAENPVKWSIMQAPPPPPPPPSTTVIVVNTPPPANNTVNGAAAQPVNTYTPPPAQPIYNTTNGAAAQPVNTYTPPPAQPTYNTVNGAAAQPTTTYTPPPAQPTYNTVNGAAAQPANNNTASTPVYVIIPRNESADISINQNNIYQGDQQIGTIQYFEVNANGMFTKTMTVFLPNGTKVAQGYTQPNGDAHVWNVVTLRDHATNTVTVRDGFDKNDVLWFLVKGQYL